MDLSALEQGGPEGRLRVAGREEGAAIWARMADRSAGAEICGPRQLPGYFADRLAAAVLAGRTDLAEDWVRSHQAGWPQTSAEYRRRLQQCWVPTRSLDGWVPTDAQPPRDSAFSGWLRDRWRIYVADQRLPGQLADIEPLDGQTWASLSQRSVFYPLTPALPGANYFDALSDSDRAEAIDRFGPTAPIDFFCFMLQVHENAHLHQVGEPLLNEIVQAAMWVGFVDTEDLWCLQRNSETGRSCCLELELVRDQPRLLELTTVSVDSAVSFSQAWSYERYEQVCAWSHCFDLGAIRYGEYLRGVGDLLARSTPDPSAESRAAGLRWGAPQEIREHLAI
jgi:hypothetical protein